MVKKAYYELYLVARSIEITEKNKTILSEFILIAESKYKVGKGLLQDVLKARVSVSRLHSTLAALRQRRSTLKALLNTLLNRDVSTPIADPTRLELTATNYDLGNLLKEAIRIRPELKASEADIGRSRAATALAQKNSKPDFTYRLAYGFRDDDVDFWSVGVSFNLPFLQRSKREEEVAEQNALQRLAIAKHQAIQNRIALDIRTALDVIKLAEEQIKIYSEAVIPQAEMALESAIAAYKVDKIDFFTLLNNQTTLFELELEFEKILVGHEIGVADLDSAVGRLPGEE